MSTQLDEALTAAGVPALVQKVIDPLLLEYQRRYSPLIRTVPTTPWNSTVYYFNRRTNRPPGGFVSDGGARPVGNSLYEQFQFTIRLLQSVGAVTGFAQEVTAAQIGDLRAREIAGAVQGLLWDIECAMIWGNDPATALGPWPQFSGLDSLVTQYASTLTNPQNAIDRAGAALALRDLDLLIDMVESNSAMPVFDDNWMFVMSPTAISKVGQLETPLQRFLTQVEVSVGLNVFAYRNIPMIKSSFLSNRAGAMGAVTAGTATTGGTLAAATYSYIIEPIMARYGPLQPSVAVPQITTGATSTATLSFATPVGPENAAPLSYRVYRGTAGAETLLGIVDGVVGLLGDGITPIYATSIVDTGAALVPQNGATQPVATPAAYVGGGAQRPRVAGSEDIFLIPRDPDILVRPYVRDVRPVDVYPTTSSPDSLPFALLSDTTLALRAPKYVGRLRSTLASL